MQLAFFWTPVARVLAVIAGLAIGALIVALALRGLRANDERERALGWERHTNVVLLQTERLAVAMRGSESAQRGYMLTSDAKFRTMFANQEAEARRLLPVLIASTVDNPRQQRNLAVVRRDVDAGLAALEHNANVAMTVGMIDPAKLVAGNLAMDKVLADLAAVRAQEERLLQTRRAAANAAEAEADRTNFILTVLGAALLGLAVIAALGALAADRRSREATERERVLAESREMLEVSVTERTDELRAANARLVAEAETRERAEGQVRQMQKMESIGQLTGGIAHDFNNMLAIVIGSLDMAKRRLNADPQRALTYIASAEEGAQRAAQLTARLLAFSRQQPLAPQSIDVNTLVASMSELLRRTIGEQIRIETVLAGGLWRTHLDAGQLENALVNLAVNARDAMESGGKLTIETANTHLDETYAAANSDVLAGQYVVICVTDNGTGMPAHVIERAFDPFFTTKGPGKGTGLGLSQVFGFTKQSGGHLKIYSEEGVGTTVKLYMPRWFGADEGGRVAASVNQEMPRGASDEIVLVVEDEQRVRHLTVDTLRELGYTVVQASDAVQALEQVRVQPRIDLLFTDIVMPGLNGRELADRARDARPGLRVLYTTGYTRNAVVHNGMLDPGVALLGKPFSMRQLAQRVRVMMDTPEVV